MLKELQKNIGISDLSDGTTILNCGIGAFGDTDLIFVESSDDEIITAKQKEMMKLIIKAVKAYNP